MTVLSAICVPCLHWYHWLAIGGACVVSGILGAVVMALAAIAKDPTPPPLLDRMEDLVGDIQSTLNDWHNWARREEKAGGVYLCIAIRKCITELEYCLRKEAARTCATSEARRD